MEWIGDTLDEPERGMAYFIVSILGGQRVIGRFGFSLSGSLPSLRALLGRFGASGLSKR